VRAGAELVAERQTGHAAYVIQAGWGCACRSLRDGGRQVIDVSLPGDVMGLRSILLRTVDHALAAVTDMTVCRVGKEQLIRLLDGQLGVGLAMPWAASRDEAMVVEHLVGLGRRDAPQRTAHLLLELGLRLPLVGLGTVARYTCPLRQSLLADTLGLSAVHLNRVLRQLREAGLVSFQKRRRRGARRGPPGAVRRLRERLSGRSAQPGPAVTRSAVAAVAAAAAWPCWAEEGGRAALAAPVRHDVTSVMDARLASGCNIGAYLGGLVSGSPRGWAWLLAALLGNALGLRLRPWLDLPVSPGQRRPG